MAAPRSLSTKFLEGVDSFFTHLDAKNLNVEDLASLNIETFVTLLKDHPSETQIFLEKDDFSSCSIKLIELFSHITKSLYSFLEKKELLVTRELLNQINLLIALGKVLKKYIVYEQNYQLHNAIDTCQQGAFKIRYLALKKGLLSRHEKIKLLLDKSEEIWLFALPDGIRLLKELFEAEDSPSEKEIEKILSNKLQFSLNMRRPTTILFYFAIVYYEKLLDDLLELVFDEEVKENHNVICQKKLKELTEKIDQYGKKGDVKIEQIKQFFALKSYSSYIEFTDKEILHLVMAYALIQIKDEKSRFDIEYIRLCQWLLGNEVVDSFPSLHESMKIIKKPESFPGVVSRTPLERKAQTLFETAKTGDEAATKQLLALAVTESTAITASRTNKTLDRKHQHAILWYTAKLCEYRKLSPDLYMHYYRQLAKFGYMPAIKLLHERYHKDSVKMTLMRRAIFPELLAAVNQGEKAACFAAAQMQQFGLLGVDRPKHHTFEYLLSALPYPGAADALVELIKNDSSIIKEKLSLRLLNNQGEQNSLIYHLFREQAAGLNQLRELTDANTFLLQARELLRLGYALKEHIPASQVKTNNFLSSIANYETAVFEFAKKSFASGALTEQEKINWLLIFNKKIWPDKLPDSVAQLDAWFSQEHVPTKAELKELIHISLWKKLLHIKLWFEYRTVIFYFAVLHGAGLADYLLDRFFKYPDLLVDGREPQSCSDFFLKKRQKLEDQISAIQVLSKEIDEIKEKIDQVKKWYSSSQLSSQWDGILACLLAQLNDIERVPFTREYVELCKFAFDDADIVDYFPTLQASVLHIDEQLAKEKQEIGEAEAEAKTVSKPLQQYGESRVMQQSLAEDRNKFFGVSSGDSWDDESGEEDVVTGYLVGGRPVVPQSTFEKISGKFLGLFAQRVEPEPISSESDLAPVPLVTMSSKSVRLMPAATMTTTTTTTTTTQPSSLAEEAEEHETCVVDPDFFVMPGPNKGR
ncbi:MAG TPA: hypothetical protein VHZ76_06400 [Gammaproteobacteria bacterium]|jgi:hypothetical protein|nr:hypothetical protein [Gammaproteobacteria bacterium]